MHTFFDLTHYIELGQEQKYKNVFVRFLVQMKTSKFAYEINWPLLSVGKFGQPPLKNADVLNGWSLKVTKIRRAYACEDDHQTHSCTMISLHCHKQSYLSQSFSSLTLYYYYYFNQSCRMNRKIIFNSLIINITRSKITEIKRLFHPFYSLHW